MNKIKLAVIGLAAAMLAGVSVQAQTNTVGGFIGSLTGYLTTFNTNADQSWAGSSFEISTGYRQITGVGAQNETSIQKDFGLFNVGASMQYSGVGSAVNGAEAQVGYALVQHFDTEIDLNVRGGFGMNAQSVRAGVIEPGLVIKKLQTSNTATELGISMPCYFKGKFNNTPTFLVAEVIRF